MTDRLAHLHEIAKLLATFETVEQTFDAALQVVVRTLPLESAIVLEVEDGHSNVIMWPSHRQTSAEMAAARAHIESAYAYLSGSRAPVDVSVTAGRTQLPEQSRPCDVDPERRFIVIPLVGGRRPVFGALQFEAATPANEEDLVFVNAIANQLAIALERDRAWRHDIRQRATAEALARRYETLVDNLDQAFVWEADGRTLEMLYASARAEQLLGYPGHDWLAAVEDPAAVQDAMRRALAEQTDQRCDHRSTALDGGVRWFHTRVHATQVDTDHPRLHGVSLDVTAMKEAEARVREHVAERERSEDAQRFLAEASKRLGEGLGSPATLDLVCRLALPRLGDLSFVHVVADDGAVRHAAWAHVDPGERTALDEFFRGASAVGADHPARRVIQTGVSELAPSADEARLHASASSDGDLRIMRDRPVRSAITVPLTLGARRLGALTVVFAESGRLHDEHDLALAEELAQRAAFALDNGRSYERAQQAIRVREQILAIVSHDLRGPLGTIVTAAELLGDTATHEEDEVRRFVGTTRRAAAHMQRLIDDLLDFASIEAGRLSITPRPHDPASMLEDVVSSFAAAAEAKGIALTAEPPAQTAQVYGDRDRIVQVLSNLVGNAIKALSRGGRIVLRAEPRERDVLFSAADTGPGITPEHLQHVFERYWRGEEADGRGMGLGLAIARGIVNAHGGQIWAESTVGEGSTFYFTVPKRTR